MGSWFPDQGIEPVSPVLEGRFLATGPPGKSLSRFFGSALLPIVLAWQGKLVARLLAGSRLAGKGSSSVLPTPLPFPAP